MHPNPSRAFVPFPFIHHHHRFLPPQHLSSHLTQSICLSCSILHLRLAFMADDIQEIPRTPSPHQEPEPSTPRLQDSEESDLLEFMASRPTINETPKKTPAQQESLAGGSPSKTKFSREDPLTSTPSTGTARMQSISRNDVETRYRHYLALATKGIIGPMPMREFLNDKKLCPPLDVEQTAAMPKADAKLFSYLPEKPKEEEMQDTIVSDPLRLSSIHLTNEIFC